jgi:single-strand DNA-binding protein
MAGSINKVILIGNVCKDPEIRSTQSGAKIANFSLATNETWKDKQTGERKEKAEFHRVVIFAEGLVKLVEQYVKKGAKLYVEGQLQTRKWTDQSGAEKYSTEVVIQPYNGTLTMVGGSPNGNGQAQQHTQAQSSGRGQGELGMTGGGASSTRAQREIDNDMPF